MRYGFGVDLGGTTVKLAFFTQSGEMLTKWEIPTVTENGGQRILPDIAAAVLGYLEKEKIRLIGDLENLYRACCKTVQQALFLSQYPGNLPVYGMEEQACSQRFCVV